MKNAGCAMMEIRTGLFQFGILPGDISGNLEKVESSLDDFSRRGCNLLLLPEMWSCGFVYKSLRTLAESTPAVVRRVCGWAAERNMVVVGSLPEAEGDTVYNTSFVVDSTGEVVGKYRKIHLFSFNGEDRFFGRGETPVIVETSVGRLGIIICYDLRFPELTRRLALEGAAIVCVSALWPEERIDAWSLLLRSRALENQLFVAGCNGCGVDGRTRFGGSSAVVSPLGRPTASGGRGEERIVARLDMDEMATFRAQLPCFADRVPQAYGGS